MKYVNDFLNFIKTSVSNFHACRNVEEILRENNFIKLYENESWELKTGENYYFVRGETSVIAFKIPKDISNLALNITASHSDSPTFKVKPNYKINSQKEYNLLNTELYGSSILSTWLDKPLSLAGRVFYKNEDNQIISSLINIDKDLLIIPNMPIHLHPDINSYKYNLQTDMLPLISLGEKSESLGELISANLNINEESILSFDLSLYNRFRGSVAGINDEMIIAPCLDDLECAYSTLQGFINSNNQENINIYALFDSEEVGSRTLEGANSNLLSDTITRIFNIFNISKEEQLKIIDSSLLLSCDNAHAVYPNINGSLIAKFDPTNKVFMNKGIVIKHSANKSYTTSALTEALFKDLMQKNGIPYQDFTNRSDVRGGGTLGAVSLGKVSINSIDIGLAQLAMHSSCETAGSLDIDYMVNAIKAFYNSKIIKKNNNIYQIIDTSKPKE